MFQNGSATRSLRRVVAALILFGALATCHGQSLGDAGLGISSGDATISIVTYQGPILSTWSVEPPDYSPPVVPVNVPQGPDFLVTNTWQVSVTRIKSTTKETGTAFVNFNSDGSYSGYGITTLSDGMYTFSGNWSATTNGQITGRYGEGSGDSGTLTGEVTSKALALTISPTNGTYKANGKPVTITNIPDFSGSWNLNFTVKRTTSSELISVTPMGGYPGIFEYSGSSPNNVSGDVMVTPAGQLTVSLDDLSTGEMAGMTGKFNPLQQTASISGRDSSNLPVRAKLTRP